MVLKMFMAAALVGTALSTHAMAETNGPISSVTLSSGGLAEIVRKAEVKGGGDIRIEVPLDQVDDVLKSLVVRDAAGSVLGIRLAGPNPLEETFRTLPFSADDLGSLPALLARVQGTEVAVTSGGKTISGKVLGVETRMDADGRQLPLLTVLGKDGTISTVLLSPDAEAKVEDPEVARKIAEATAAAGKGKTDGSRAVSIGVAGSGDREVGISYVVPSPIWKTAYRIVVGKEGKARLQAWAVLENASGEDWDGVKISLSSGEPTTLRQRLYQHYWRERTEVPVDTSASAAPLADSGGLGQRQKAGGKRNAAGIVAPRAPAPMMAMAASDSLAAPAEATEEFAMAAAGDTGTSSEGDVTATFDLPGTYDLASGDTMSLPIVDADVEASMVSVFRAGSASRHPVAAVMIDNSTGVSLPAGIVTVYDSKAGYVGDSSLLGLPAGDSRMASFATDAKVTVVSDVRPSQRITQVKVVDGMVHVAVKNSETTTYTVSGALDAPRTVVIEHPRRQGWTFSSPEDDGETATHHRLKVEVPAGGERKVTATYEMLGDEVYALSDAEPQLISGWSASADDKETAAKLEELAKARQAEMDASRSLQSIAEEIQQVETGQERVRQNLAAVPPDSDLQRSYLAMLADQEAKIADLEKRRQAEKAVLDGLSGKVREAIRAF